MEHPEHLVLQEDLPARVLLIIGWVYGFPHATLEVDVIERQGGQLAVPHTARGEQPPGGP